jgi:hypothetical protein
MGDISGLSLNEKTKTTYERIPFGKEMLKQFPFGPNFKNLNHGMKDIPHNFHSFLCQLASHNS